MKIACNEFIKRQTKESKYAHFNGTWAELEALTETHFDNQQKG
jgi:hypothetical protein